MTPKSILTAEEEAQLKATYATELERTLARTFLTEYNEKSEAVIKNYEEQIALLSEREAYITEVRKIGIENLTYFEEQYFIKRFESFEKELAEKEAEEQLLQSQLEKLTNRLEVA